MANYFEPITEEKLKIICDEFGASEESLQNDVNILMDWLEKQPHLPNVKDIEWLTHFLLSCKNSLERTKYKLDVYFTAKALNPNIFTCRKEMITELYSFNRLVCFIPMPKLTIEGHRVLIFRIFSGNNYNATSEQLVNFSQLIYDTLMKADMASRYIMVFDTENMTIPIMTICFPVLKKLLEQIMRINPIRIHKIYTLNVSPTVDPLINFSLNLMSKKLASRHVIWKKKSRELAEVINEEVLPPLYGGTEKPMEELCDLFVDYIKGCTNWFESEEKAKADLSKKPTDNRVPRDVGDYGVEGTFRKINLD